MSKRFMSLEYALCKELGQLEEKYRSGAEMSEGDLRRIDLLVHSMKSLATYTAMKSAEDEQNMSYMNNSYDMNHMNNLNNSYMNNSYRGRDSMGRYMSSDMNSEMSGHYPPMYPQDRRW